MLSRTAENLYWTARYLERADSIARLLEVAYRIHLIPNTEEGYISVTGATVSLTGFQGAHQATGIPIDTPTGTVVSTIDEEFKYRHANVKISDTVGDKRVYGVVENFRPEQMQKIVSQMPEEPDQNSSQDKNFEPVQEGTLSERSKGYSETQVVQVIKDNFPALKWLHGNRSKKKGFARPAIIGPIVQLITSDEKVGKAFYNDFIGASLKKSKSNAARMLAKHLEKVNQMKADGKEMSLGVYSSRGYDEMVYWHKNTLKAIEAFKNDKNIKFK